MLTFVVVNDLIGDPLRSLQPVKLAEQRADVVEPWRREYQPGGCFQYRLKLLQKVRRNTSQGRVTGCILYKNTLTLTKAIPDNGL